MTSISVYRLVGGCLKEAFVVPRYDLFRILRVLSINDPGTTYVF